MKKGIVLLICLSFLGSIMEINADFNDVLGPTATGALVGGLAGGRRGAGIGAGVGLGLGLINSSSRDRERERAYYYRQRPVRRVYYYDDYDDGYDFDYLYDESPAYYRGRNRYSSYREHPAATAPSYRRPVCQRCTK